LVTKTQHVGLFVAPAVARSYTKEVRCIPTSFYKLEGFLGKLVFSKRLSNGSWCKQYLLPLLLFLHQVAPHRDSN